MDFLKLLVEATGWTLLHFVWQGFFIGLLHECALRMSAARSPQLRYAISLTSLLMLAVIPLATFVMQWNAVAPATTGENEPLAHALVSVVNTVGGAASPELQSAKLETWLMYVVLAWLIGVTTLSARFGLGVLSLRRLIRGADFDAVDEWVRHELERLQQYMGVKRHVRVALSTQVASPMVVGWLRPIIFLPLSAATGLDHQQIRMVLAHELAHLRRYDPVVNIVQVAIETLFFYHPTVYRISRSLRQEREQCCDDLAIAVGSNRLAYARVLAELETMRQNQRRQVLALGIVNQELYARVERLVGDKRTESGKEDWLPLILIALAGLVFAGKTLDFNAPLFPSLAEYTPQRQRLPLALPEAAPRQFVPISAPADEQLQAGRGAEEQTTTALLPAKADQRERSKSGEEPVVVAQVKQTELPERTASAPATAQAPVMNAAPEASLDENNIAQESARVSAGGELIKTQEPRYPRQALRAGTEGHVLLAFTITEQGDVTEIEVVQAEPRGVFDRAAMEAVSSWQYQPFTENGKAVAKRVSQAVEFRLSPTPQKRGGTSPRDCREQTGTRLCRAADDANTQLTILRN